MWVRNSNTFVKQAKSRFSIEDDISTEFSRNTVCIVFSNIHPWRTKILLKASLVWRLLPKPYGNWNSVYKRFARWCDKDVFQRMHQHFAKDPDMEWLIIDTTIIRAHPCAGGALKTSGGQASQALGRSRGGFSTKIHIAVDGLGNRLHFMLTAGQRHDITCAEALTSGYNSEYVIADTSYDSMAFIESITDRGAVPVIPPRANRRDSRTYDVHLYRERHLVECCINKIKQYRRISSRFDKLAVRYMGFLSFVATIIWLR